MALPEKHPWSSYLQEVAPQAALSTRNGDRPFVTHLQVEGGIVEFVDYQNLSPEQTAITCLGALSLTDEQIAETLHYSKLTIWDNQLKIFDKLDARNRVHTVRRLFTKGIARVVSPIAPPDLTDDEHAVWQQIADGNDTQTTADNLAISFSSSKNHMAAILRKFGAPRMPRASLLGHMSRLLAPDDIETDEYSIGVSLQNQEHEQWPKPIDYLAWQGGVIALNPRARLTALEQHVFVQSLVGMQRSKIAMKYKSDVPRIESVIWDVIAKLDGCNFAHAVHQAFKLGECTVVHQCDGVRLTPRESEILTRLANGEDEQNIKTSMHIGATTLGGHRRDMFQKLAVASIPAAIAKGHLGKNLGW